MRYMVGGVEIQYREAQIMREAAKTLGLLEEGSLLRNEEKWIMQMASETEEHPIKASLIPPMIRFIEQMDAERKAAVAEYVEYLVRKERGIDIMVPFTTTSHYTILPVNIHETADDEEREE